MKKMKYADEHVIDSVKPLAAGRPKDVAFKLGVTDRTLAIERRSATCRLTPYITIGLMRICLLALMFVLNVSGQRQRETRAIFDQNDTSFYADSVKRLVQYPPASGTALPIGRFAVYVGLKGDNGFIDAIMQRPDLADLKTGYYVIPQPKGGSLNAFGLVIQADDPRNSHGDISYVMPCVWLSDITMPPDKILRPWTGDFNALEYSVDMRVPLAHSGNIYHPHLVDDDATSKARLDFAAPYVLGALYFEQLRSLRGKLRPPALWLAVTMFDLRKHYAREVITVDNWTGGTNFPIVMTTIGQTVAPDDGSPFPDAPPATPMPTKPPAYSYTLPGSEPLQTESSSDPAFRQFAFRVTSDHFLAAINRIRSRMPDVYGENGTAPMSTDLSDWGLTHFNLDAEIFHSSTLQQPVSAANSRALVVEFKNLRLQQAGRLPAVKGFFESVAPDPDGNVKIRGWACIPDSEEKLRISLSGITIGGSSRKLQETTADLGSEAGIQEECRLEKEGPLIRSDGKGFRFNIEIKRSELAGISNLDVSTEIAGHSVRIRKVPGWRLVLDQKP